MAKKYFSTATNISPDVFLVLMLKIGMIIKMYHGVICDSIGGTKYDTS